MKPARMERFSIRIPSELKHIRKLPVFALDLGCSRKRTSCGIATDGGKPIAGDFHFGQVRGILIDWLNSLEVSEAVLILEAPLSYLFYHKDGSVRNGNPQMRRFESTAAFEPGTFATDRNPRVPVRTSPWYCNAGAMVTLAARRLLESLHDAETDVVVHLVEGFHPRWERGQTAHDLDCRTDNHVEVAQSLVRSFKSEETKLVIPTAAGDERFSKNAAALAGFKLDDADAYRPPPLVFASAILHEKFNSSLLTSRAS